jgi:membrane protein insertase Oxa1/YidC/SpoIIIJ
MKKMQGIQPELQKIKEKYKDYVPKPDVRERKRLRMREKIRNLDDYYVQRIIHNNTGLPPHLQSKSLIEVQKLIIQIKRELRK